MSQAFAPLPYATRASSRGRPTSAMPVRVGISGKGFLKPLPRGADISPSTDRFTAVHDMAISGLSELAEVNHAQVVHCEDPKTLGFVTDYPACVSIARFSESIVMEDVTKHHLKGATKAVRRKLRERVARDYVFRCWVGDVDRNSGGYAFETRNGELTGEMDGFDGVASFQETLPRVDIEEWPSFFAKAAVGDRPECVEARKDTARKIVNIKRKDIEKVFAGLPAAVKKGRPIRPIVDYLVERQAVVEKLFLGD